MLVHVSAQWSHPNCKQTSYHLKLAIRLLETLLTFDDVQLLGSIMACTHHYALLFPWSGFSPWQRLLEISNSLSEAELKQMKFLARPKVNACGLNKISEGFELFEELETIGELSYTYVRELLKGIQRFDLVQKLDIPVPENAESGKHSFGCENLNLTFQINQEESTSVFTLR